VSATLESLKAKIELDDSLFQKGVNSTINSIEKLNQNFQRTFSTINSLSTKMVSAFSVSFNKVAEIARATFEKIALALRTVVATAKQVLNGVVEYAKVAFQSIEKVGKSLATVGAAVLTSFGYAIKKAADAESAFKRLQIATNGNLSALNVLIAAQEKLTKTGLFNKTDVNNALSKAYAMGKNYQLTADQISNIVEIASNLGNIYGYELPDATERLMAAMRGEAEASEALGLSLSQTAVKNWMLTKGIQGNIETMDLASQAQVRYNMLLDTTQDYMGASAKASETLNGVWTQLKTAISSIVVTIGEQFIDEIKTASKALLAFVQLAGQSDHFKNLVRSIAGLMLSFTMLGVTLTILGKIGGMAISLLSISFALLSNPIFLVVAGIGLLAVKWGELSKVLTDMGFGEQVTALENDFARLGKAFKNGDLGEIGKAAANIAVDIGWGIWKIFDMLMTSAGVPEWSDISTAMDTDIKKLKTAIDTGDIGSIGKSLANIGVDLLWGVWKLLNWGMTTLGVPGWEDVNTAMTKDITALKIAIDKGDLGAVGLAAAQIGVDLLWGAWNVLGKLMTTLGIPGWGKFQELISADIVNLKKQLETKDLGNILTAVGKLALDLIWGTVTLAGEAISNGLDGLADKIRLHYGLSTENNKKIDLGDLTIFLAGTLDFGAWIFEKINSGIVSVNERVKQAVKALRADYENIGKEKEKLEIRTEVDVLKENWAEFGTQVGALLQNSIMLTFDLYEVMKQTVKNFLKSTTENDVFADIGSRLASALAAASTLKLVLGDTFSASELGAFLTSKKGFLAGVTGTFATFAVGLIFDKVADVTTGSQTIEDAIRDVLIAASVGLGLGFISKSSTLGTAAFTITLAIIPKLFSNLEDNDVKNLKSKIESLQNISMNFQSNTLPAIQKYVVPDQPSPASVSLAKDVLNSYYNSAFKTFGFKYAVSELQQAFKKIIVDTGQGISISSDFNKNIQEKYPGMASIVEGEVIQQYKIFKQFTQDLENLGKNISTIQSDQFKESIDKVKKEFEELATTIQLLNPQITISNTPGINIFRSSGYVPHFSTGAILQRDGIISGPGTGKSDSILAMVSNGEAIINAASTKKYRGLLAAINSGTLGNFSTGRLPHFDNGNVFDDSTRSILNNTFNIMENFVNGIGKSLVSIAEKILDVVISALKPLETKLNEALSKDPGLQKTLGIEKVDFTSILQSTKDNMKDALKESTALIDDMKEAVNRAKADLKIDSGSASTDKQLTFWDSMMESAKNYWSYLAELSKKSTSDKLVQSFSDAFKNIYSVAYSFMKSIPLTMENVYKKMQEDYKQSGANNPIEYISEKLNNTMETLKSSFLGIFKIDLKKVFSFDLNALFSGMHEGFAVLMSVISSVVAALGTFVAALAIGEIFSGMMKSLQPLFTKIAEPLQRLGQIMGAMLIPVFEFLIPVVEAFAKLLAKVILFIAPLINLVIGVLNGFIGALRSINLFGYQPFKDLKDIGTINTVQLADFANGTAPTSNPSQTPVEGMSNQAASNQTITNTYSVTFTGNTVLDVDDEAMKTLVKKFKQYVGEHGGNAEVFGT